MWPKNRAISTANRLVSDVAPPQIASDARLGCLFAPKSVKVRSGRTQAVYFLKRGLQDKSFPALQEHWSRGCRRAHVSFLVFCCWALWPHAHQKKKKLYLLKSRFQPSRPIPANTSNLLRRAGRGYSVRHAEFSTTRSCALARMCWLDYTSAAPITQERRPC